MKTSGITLRHRLILIAILVVVHAVVWGACCSLIPQTSQARAGLWCTHYLVDRVM